MNRQEICWTDHHSKSDRPIIELPYPSLARAKRLSRELDFSDIDERNKAILRSADIIIPPPETRPITEEMTQVLTLFRNRIAQAYESIGVSVLASSERARIDLGANWHDIENANGELIKVRIRGPRANEYIDTQDLQHPKIRRETRRIVSQSNRRTRLMVLTEYIPGAISLHQSEIEISNRIGVILEALEGSIYISDQALCHGDIKPENILIKPNGQALLADLESLTVKDKTAPGDEFFTNRYYDREFYEESKPDEARDVFAWALTILNSISPSCYRQICLLRRWTELKQIPVPERYYEITSAIDEAGLEDKNLRELLKRCFHYVRTQRPSLREVYNVLNAYKETL